MNCWKLGKNFWKYVKKFKKIYFKSMHEHQNTDKDLSFLETFAESYMRKAVC